MKVDSRTVRSCFTVAGLVAAVGIVAAQEAPKTTSAAARLAPWKTVAASGQVEAHAPATALEAWRRVSRGDSLSPQTTVRTGKKSRATLARNGSILIVDRDSRVELPTVVEAGSPSSVKQTHGSVVYEIEKGDSRHFEVVTPYLVAGVKGTTFMVTVDERTTSVSVREGLVEVTSAMTGEKSDVGPGETLLLGTESESRMELVSSRRSDDGPRGRKPEGDARARDDAARMASLLDPHDSRRDAQGAEATPDRVEELAGAAVGDAAGELDGLADDMTRGGGQTDLGLDVGLDPLRDPMDGLPVDAIRDPGPGASDPVTPGPGRPGPGIPGAGPSGPGNSLPGSAFPTVPDEPQARRPSRS